MYQDTRALPNSVRPPSQMLRCLAFHIKGKWKFFVFVFLILLGLRTELLVKFKIVQTKDAILLNFPKPFISMGQSKITNE